jgi:hypothetical protein
MTYDPTLGGVVLFGGMNDTGILQNSTWLYKAGNWSELNLAREPPARDLANMVWDARGNYLLLFGGYGSQQYLNDTWIFVGGTWYDVSSPSSAPTARYGASMAYDYSLGEVVLFGGESAYSTLNDTWTFSDGLWTELYPSGTNGPSPRLYATFAWNPLIAGVGGDVLFGGYSPFGPQPLLGDEWEFVYGSWVQVSPNPALLPRYGAAMVWDNSTGSDILFGGYDFDCLNDTWAVTNGTFTYLSAQLPVTPPPSLWDSMAFDLADGYALLYGGLGNSSQILNQTWAIGVPSSLTIRSFMATPNPVPVGRSTILAVSVDGNQSGLSYNYSGLPSGCQTENNSSLACTPILEGDYNVTVHARATNGQTETTIELMVLGAETLRDVAINPMGWYLKTGQQRTFFAFANGSYGSDLTSGTSFRWSLSPAGMGNLSTTTGSNITFTAGDSTGQANLSVIGTFNNTSRSASASINITAGPPPPTPLDILSEFGGDFLTNLTLTNEFGIYSPPSVSFRNVNGSACGQVLTFAQVNGAGPWTSSMDMGTCLHGQNLTVNATAANNNQPYQGTLQLPMYWAPHWFEDFLALSGISSVNPPSVPGQWNQSYRVLADLPADLSNRLTGSVPVPLLGQLVTDLLPSPNINATFVSGPDDSTLTLNGYYAANPHFELAGIPVDIGATVTVVGNFSLDATGFIQWNSAWLKTTGYGSVSVTLPIVGDSFELGNYNVTLGLSFTLTVSPGFVLDLLLAPTNAASGEFINGSGLEVEAINGTVGFSMTPEVTFGLGIFSVSAGANLRFTEQFGSPPFRLVDTNVEGNLFAQFSALWGLVSWTWNSGLYNVTTLATPSVSMLEAAFTSSTIALNRSLLPRYYDVDGYDNLVWVPGQNSGTAIHDIFPNTRVASAGSASTASLLYTTDNVSMASSTGIQLQALAVNTTSRSLSRMPAPPTPGEIAFAPQLTALPNGTELAVWEGVPDSAVSQASYNTISGTILQGALFDPATESWGPVHSMGSVRGYVQGAEAGACGSSDEVVALVSNSLVASGAENLTEYDFASGKVIHNNVSIDNYRSLDGFNCLTNQAIVQNATGSDIIFNLTTGFPVNALQGVFIGHALDVDFVSGARDTLAVLFSNSGFERLVLYSPLTGIAYGPFVVSSNTTTNLQAIEVNGTYYLVLGSPGQEQVWSILSPTQRQILLSNPEQNLTQDGIAASSSGIVIWALNSYGTLSQPFLNLTLSIIPESLSIPSPPTPAQPTTHGTSSVADWTFLAISASIALVVAVMLVVIYRGRRRKSEGAEASTSNPQTGPEIPVGAVSPKNVVSNPPASINDSSRMS